MDVCPCVRARVCQKYCWVLFAVMTENIISPIFSEVKAENRISINTDNGKLIAFAKQEETFHSLCEHSIVPHSRSTQLKNSNVRHARMKCFDWAACLLTATDLRLNAEFHSRKMILLLNNK